MDCLRLDRYAFDLKEFPQRLHRVRHRSIHSFVDVERRKMCAVALGYSAPHHGERA
jgi:hypothetical protein